MAPAKEVIWEPNAVADLNRILSSLSDRAAERLQARIHVALAGLDDDVREILISPYILLYWYAEDSGKLFVLQIRHERRSTHGGETLHEPLAEYGA